MFIGDKVDRSGYPEKLARLIDVNISTLNHGEILYWDDSAKKWKNQAITGGGDMLRSQNLNDLTNKAQARMNLGLGTSATKDVGTGADQVAWAIHTHSIDDIIGLRAILDRVREQWENLTTGDMVSVPEHYNSYGEKGDEAFDDSYYYICVANNLWCRIPIAIGW